MQTQYTIKPLFKQFTFRIVDLGAVAIDGFVIPDGAKGKQQAAQVIDIGPDCKVVNVGDNLILAEGLTFGGYPGADGETVHMISEECVLARYECIAEAGITMLS